MTHPDTSQMLGTRPADDLDGDALTRWMAEAIPGFDGPLAYVRFAGGHRNRTYRIDTPHCAYVLRCRPSDRLPAPVHPIEREYRLLQALQPTGYPAPRPLALCGDSGVIGAPFYVMALVEGRTLWDEAMPGMTAAHRREHYDAWIDALAALHAIDRGALGDETAGLAPCRLEHKLAYWTQADGARATPELARLADWLPIAVPTQSEPALVHGDFRLQNLVFSQKGVRVASVFDWDRASFGDRWIDLAYVLARWVRGSERQPGLDELAGAESGIPTSGEMIERYAQASGRTPGAALDWHLAYTLFRLALVEQGADSAQSVALATAAWRYAERAGA